MTSDFVRGELHNDEANTRLPMQVYLSPINKHVPISSPRRLEWLKAWSNMIKLITGRRLNTSLLKGNSESLTTICLLLFFRPISTIRGNHLIAFRWRVQRIQQIQVDPWLIFSNLQLMRQLIIDRLQMQIRISQQGSKQDRTSILELRFDF